MFPINANGDDGGNLNHIRGEISLWICKTIKPSLLMKSFEALRDKKHEGLVYTSFSCLIQTKNSQTCASFISPLA